MFSQPGHALARRRPGAGDGFPLSPVIGLIALLFLIAPFAALAFATEWRHFHFVAGDLDAAIISAVLSLVALPVIAALGTPLAWWLARGAVRWKWLIDALVLLPLLTPPLALGILLASLYGPYGPAGVALGRVGLVLTNTWPAFVLAQIYGAMPYYVITARVAFEAVPRELEEIGLTLGKERWQIFLQVSLPMARLGIAAGLALAWVRALGEFGIVLIIAYFPHGIPVKLWVNLEDSGLSSVYPLLWLFFLVALPLPLWLGIISRRRGIF
ncbi:MAG: molybdate ABC transporter permease subunit [Acetobacteraceae bacterium]